MDEALGRLGSSPLGASYSYLDAGLVNGKRVHIDAIPTESVSIRRIGPRDVKLVALDRRLIQPDFIALLATRVAPGGRLHLATDWADYAEHMRSVLEAAPAWRNVAGSGQFVPRPQWRIETHFEKRGRRLGHGVWDVVFVKR